MYKIFRKLVNKTKKCAADDSFFLVKIKNKWHSWLQNKSFYSNDINSFLQQSVRFDLLLAYLSWLLALLRVSVLALLWSVVLGSLLVLKLLTWRLRKNCCPWHCCRSQPAEKNKVKFKISHFYKSLF